MSRKTTKGYIATDETFDSFLQEQGLLAEAEERAIKELSAEQIRDDMENEGITKKTRTNSR